jgi:hypothetical protein
MLYRVEFTSCSDMHIKLVVHTVTSRLQKVKQPGDVPVCVCADSGVFKNSYELFM